MPEFVEAVYVSSCIKIFKHGDGPNDRGETSEVPISERNMII
jgi:hypothetical protein